MGVSHREGASQREGATVVQQEEVRMKYGHKALAPCPIIAAGRLRQPHWPVLLPRRQCAEASGGVAADVADYYCAVLFPSPENPPGAKPPRPLLMP
jgi:hypothetical protein